MNKLKETVTEQLRALQILMHKTGFGHGMGHGKGHNPHRGQGRILALLKLKPEISQKELTELLGMSKQAVAELIAKLEKSGAITRTPDEEDKRVMTIRLTQKGNIAAEDAQDAAPDSAKGLDCFTAEELAVFSEYLARMIKQYEEQFPGEDFEERRKKMKAFMAFHNQGENHHCGAGGHGHGHGHKYGHGHGGRCHSREEEQAHSCRHDEEEA